MNSTTAKEGEAMYQAVIFDFDGTLIDSETHLFDVINAQLTKYGAEPVSKAFYQRSIGGAAQELQDYLTKALGDEKKAEIYEIHHHTMDELPFRTGIDKLLQQLKQHNIPMAIATSSYTKDIEAAYKALGLDQYIDVMIGREAVSQVKPDPEPYLTAAQALHFNPEHCLALEDSINGATSAVRAGLDVIVNTNPITESQDFSDITHLAKEVPALDIFEQYIRQGKE